jgi:predicted nuclease of predicted toxin-antitoxin system
VKILLDHNLDWRLKRHLPGHEAASANEMGWEDLRNGELLSRAEGAGFEVLLTGDANLNYQQNLSGRSIALVVIRAFDNRRKTHIPMMPEVLGVIEAIQPGQVVEVLHADVRRKAERDAARNQPGAGE